jgi:hypothetical protein
LSVAAAVSVICLVFPEPFVGDLFYTAGWLLIAFGVIAAIYSRGERRAYLIGFLILFGGYFYQSAWPNDARAASAYYQGGRVRYLSPGLISTKLLAYAYARIHSGGNTFWSQAKGTPARMSTPDKIAGRYMAFMVVGHTLIALGLGAIGGRVAQRLALPASPASKRQLEEILQEIDSE